MESVGAELPKMATRRNALQPMKLPTPPSRGSQAARLRRGQAPQLEPLLTPTASMGALPSSPSGMTSTPLLVSSKSMGDIELACDLVSWSTRSPAAGGSEDSGSVQRFALSSILDSFKFFKDLDAGVRAKLPEIATVVSHTANTILFHQGDPPGNCYVVLSGEVAIYEKNSEERVVTPGPPATPDSTAPSERRGLSRSRTLPSLKRQGTTSASSRLWSPEDEEAADATLSRSPSRGPDNEEEEEEAVGVALGNGSSGVGEMTSLGIQMAVLRPGTLFGELALLNDQPRSATSKCLAKTDLLVIRRLDFDNILREEMLRKGDEKFRFLMAHVPGMREVAIPKPAAAGLGAKLHASFYFRKACFQRGHAFLREGSMTEPSIFVLHRGAIEFRRLDEQGAPAAASAVALLGGRRQLLPLAATSSAPALPDLGGGIQAVASHTWSGVPFRRDPRGVGSKLPAPGSKGATSARSSPRGADEAWSRVGILLPGGVFGSLPVAASEPFTVTVTSAFAEVFLCAGADVAKLPRKLYDTVREYIAYSTTWRLRCHSLSRESRRRREREQHPQAWCQSANECKPRPTRLVRRSKAQRQQRSQLSGSSGPPAAATAAA